jgi:hypothetical protein
LIAEKGGDQIQIPCLLWLFWGAGFVVFAFVVVHDVGL